MVHHAISNNGRNSRVENGRVVTDLRLPFKANGSRGSHCQGDNTMLEYAVGRIRGGDNVKLVQNRIKRRQTYVAPFGRRLVDCEGCNGAVRLTGGPAIDVQGAVLGDGCKHRDGGGGCLDWQSG